MSVVIVVHCHSVHVANIKNSIVSKEKVVIAKKKLTYTRAQDASASHAPLQSSVTAFNTANMGPTNGGSRRRREE